MASLKLAPMKSVCVYCGSNPGSRPEYALAAKELAEALVARNLRLVYGGAKVGIMGLVADSVLQLGGEAVGVIPDALVEREVAHEGLTELHVVRSMHERKTLMAKLSDGFVTLPGGLGTLEEIFEIWTWAHLGFHHKPIGLVNVEGYYNSLLQFLDHAADQGYIQNTPKEMLLVEPNGPALLDAFTRYVPPVVPQVLEADEV